MRMRLLVIAVFVSASTVPGVLALSTGLLGGDSLPASTSKSASGEFRVTTLGWPHDALGLASTPELVAWQQRSAGGASAGVWTYDVRSQRSTLLIARRNVGRNASELSLSDHVAAWTAHIPGSAKGTVGGRAYDTDALRLFTVAARAYHPVVSGDDIAWVTRRDGAGTQNSVTGIDTVTDAQFVIRTGERVRSLALDGRWVAWISGPPSRTTVWAANVRRPMHYQLATGATAVATDGQRVVWAARAGSGETAIVAWNTTSNASKEIYRARGAVSSLALSNNVVVWQQGTGNGDVWAYDFNRRRAYAVCDNDAEQECPVLVGRTAFWADKRSGQWELYGRVLQP
jgi:hypothetical protein